MPDLSEEKRTFEEALKELETIVKRLDTDREGLSKALQHYERGTELAKECISYLEEAEQRIEELTLALERPQ